MNWIDVVVIIAVAVSGVRGVVRGLRAGGPEMASFLVAFFFGLVSYHLVAWVFAALMGPGLLANALGLLVVWLAAQWAILLLFRKVWPIPEKAEPSPWDHAGGALGVLEGLVLCALFLTLCVVFPSERLPKQAVVDSALGRPLVEIAFGFEGRLAEWLGGPFGTSLAFRTLTPGAHESIALHFRSTQVEVSREDEQSMLAMVNQERSKRGLSPLTWDERLADAARGHSLDMLRRGYMGHTSPDGVDTGQRIAAAGVKANTWGENVAVAPTVMIAHSGLMSSPGHRANILNPEFKSIGIGVVKSRVFGTAFTQDFTA
jgi:uncharacterized protein YkwD/uncharacterized membrane protein required for colicin V production